MQLRIKVKPNAKTDGISREADGAIKVKIRAQPVEGKANKYLLQYLAEVFKLPKSSITLLKGEATQFKTIEIDASDAYVQEVLNKAIS